MLTCMFYSKCVQFKKTKNNDVIKAHELGKYVCSIVNRRTHVVVNQVHEYLQPWLEHKESKEVLSSFILSFKWILY
jgi:excinuclease UvrABC nuclease subunit